MLALRMPTLPPKLSAPALLIVQVATSWIDTAKGHPNSDALHVTERFRRTDFGHIYLAITIDDPRAYLKPWTIHTTLILHPDTELLEAFCDDHDATILHRKVTPAPPEPHSVANSRDQSTADHNP